MIKPLSNNRGVFKSSTLAGQRELLREYRNKLNEVIQLLNSREDNELERHIKSDNGYPGREQVAQLLKERAHEAASPVKEEWEDKLFELWNSEYKHDPGAFADLIRKALAKQKEEILERVGKLPQRPVWIAEG